MILPDYNGGSIANLMASIAAAHSDEFRPLPVLRTLGPTEIAAHRSTVLLVVDALGHDFLARHGSGALARQLRARITSVFPSTTAAAIPTFLTGLPPARHGLTGWHMYLRELGSVLAVLPGHPRYGGVPYGKAGITVRDLFGNTPFFDCLRIDCHVVVPQSIAHSDFNRAHVGRAHLHAFQSLDGLFATVARIVRDAAAPSYVYAYWPQLDRLGHEQGIGSAAACAHLAELESAFGSFLDMIAGSDTLVVATADHGMIDATEIIELDAHPGIAGGLTLPLCGEPRAAYCYLQAGREQDFEQRLRETLGDTVTAYRSEEILHEGWFGPGPVHPRLAARIGDYTLLPEGLRMLIDRLFGEKMPRLIGVHGGLTAAEMYVPLIVASA
jgi:predicted AlkP superfamily pyrophosphatase or phosphodiesterase